MDMQEHEQLALLKDFWQQYRYWLIGGVLLGIGGSFGYQGWQSRAQQRAQQASIEYKDLLTQWGQYEQNQKKPAQQTEVLAKDDAAVTTQKDAAKTADVAIVGKDAAKTVDVSKDAAVAVVGKDAVKTADVAIVGKDAVKTVDVSKDAAVAVVGKDAVKTADVGKDDAADSESEEPDLATQWQNLRTTIEHFTDDYQDTSYAVLAALLLTTLLLEENDLEAAQKTLEEAVQSSPSQALTDIVRLRLVRVLLANEKTVQAEQELQLLADTDYPLAVAELRGDIHHQKGNLKQAAKAYQNALSLAEEFSQQSPISQKLNALPASAVADADKAP